MDRSNPTRPATEGADLTSRHGAVVAAGVEAGLRRAAMANEMTAGAETTEALTDAAIEAAESELMGLTRQGDEGVRRARSTHAGTMHTGALDSAWDEMFRSHVVELAAISDGLRDLVAATSTAVRHGHADIVGQLVDPQVAVDDARMVVRLVELMGEQVEVFQSYLGGMEETASGALRLAEEDVCP